MSGIWELVYSSPTTWFCVLFVPDFVFKVLPTTICPTENDKVIFT
jgi:hypothetical protein